MAAVTGKGYIGLVKQYIEKIFKHEAKLYDHNQAEFDIVLRKGPDGNIRIYTYSTKHKKLLREIKDTEAEKILTS